jgi:hypothetical protein
MPPILCLLTLGRMTVTAAYYICLQYASEIFPTIVRQDFFNSCLLPCILVYCTLTCFFLNYVKIDLLVDNEFNSTEDTFSFRGQGVAMCEILGGVATMLSPYIVYLVIFLC